jgi:hypothetical protein
VQLLLLGVDLVLLYNVKLAVLASKCPLILIIWRIKLSLGSGELNVLLGRLIEVLIIGLITSEILRRRLAVLAEGS